MVPPPVLVYMLVVPSAKATTEAMPPPLGMSITVPSNCGCSGGAGPTIASVTLSAAVRSPSKIGSDDRELRAVFRRNIAHV